jgi:hypothetical protein
MTAYVHGPDSAHYDFTSALPVQLLVKLAPSLMPMIDRQDTVTVPGLHVERAAPAPAGPADAVARDTEQAAPADAAAADAAPVETTSGAHAAPRTPVTDDRAPARAPAVKAAEPKAVEPKAAEAKAVKPAAKAAETGAKPAAKPAEKAAEKPATAEQHPKAIAIRKADADGQPKPAVRKPDAEAQAKPARKPAAKPDADADVPPKAQRAKPPAVEEVLQ